MSIQKIVSQLDSSLGKDERLRVLVIGSHEGVAETIRTLHKLRYAEVAAWSSILPVPNSTEFMSILTRVRTTSEEARSR
jgi:hypothetical protein